MKHKDSSVQWNQIFWPETNERTDTTCTTVSSFYESGLKQK